jgi:DNA repair protein RadC
MKDSFTIHDLPLSKSPQEKLQKYGAQKLSDQEILALIMGRGITGESVMVTARCQLKRFRNLKAIIKASLEEFSQVRSISLVKAVQIKTTYELVNRIDGCLQTAEKSVIKPEL